MSVLDPDHLLDQAERLVAFPSAGPPRQVDLRRAVSAAYYAVFHHLLTAAADDFVGRTKRSTQRYTLVYRSVDHRRLRDLCQDVKRPTLTLRYARYAPPTGFGDSIRDFAGGLSDLQEKRHAADYDPSSRMKTSDARLAIAMARRTIDRFEEASAPCRGAFLALLLFTPR